MLWASSLSLAPDLERAVAEAAAELDEQLGNQVPDLVLAFVSSAYEAGLQSLPAFVRRRLGGGLLIGCSGRGVIGRGREVEARPALALAGAVMPEVDLVPFYLPSHRLPAEDAGLAEWERALGVRAESAPHFLLFAEARALALEPLLGQLDRAFPSALKVGGVASGGLRGDVLYLGACAYRSGVVGVALAGNIEIDCLVSHGCRPIGDPLFVTRCRGSLVFELDGRPAAAVLKEIYENASEKDRKLFRRALCLGLARASGVVDVGTASYVVRDVVGLDEETGAIAVAARVAANEVVQFHVRDARTSAVELDTRLARYARESRRRPEGALLFSCVGRGMSMYGCTDHDTNVFRARLGNVPLGGFFCNGEIATAGSGTAVHGYTSSFALFRSRAAA